MTQCSHPGHQLESYTQEQRDLFAEIRVLNDRIIAGHQSGLALDGVIAAIDPDPARYMFVDEGRDTLRRQLEFAHEALAAATPMPGHLRLGGRPIEAATFAARPSVAVSPSGDEVIAWIEWIEGTGEHVTASVGGDVRRLNHDPADCHRPTVVVDTAGTPWCFYGMAIDGEVRVYYQRYSDGEWTPPEPMTDTSHPSFNQEVIAHPDGSVEAVWQGRSGPRFSIYSRRWTPDGGWADTVEIDDSTASNAWDPVLAALPGGGTIYAWCGYEDHRYRIHFRRRDHRGLGPVHMIDQDSGHSLHPSIGSDTEGRVWCTFDAFDVPEHGGSGPTQLRAAARVGTDLGWPGLGEPGLFMPAELVPPVEAHIRVIEMTADGVAENSVGLATDVHISPSAYPRLAVTPGGSVSLAYRILRRLPLMTYHWEVAVQHLGSDGWEAPSTFESSDAGLEEPAVAASEHGLLVAWTVDGRAARNADWTDGFGGLECPDLREHYGEVVWHGIHDAGRVHWTTLAALPPPPSSPKTNPTARVSSGQTRSREEGRYRTEIDDTAVQLYWGDLHRHSLISRCTAGDEPAIDDMYRYAWDISDYDFWALTDHSENSTAFQWWTIQKAADLFCVPQLFVPFYGFEWTSQDSGHQNVIFDSARRGAPIISSLADDSDTPDKLWRHLRRFVDYPSITIPHHPGSAMVPFDWDYRDDAMTRIVEIFQSCRGSYESDGCFRQYSDATLPGTFVFDALRRGHRFGLIGSSDHGFGTGYVGAFAPGLERASIFEALQRRRTIAATRRDIVVDARIGTTFMGGETTIGELAGPVEMAIHARGYTDIARIECVKNGTTVESFGPDLDLPSGWSTSHIRVEWGWGPGTTDWSGTLEIDGGELCQTEYWSPEIVEVGRHRVRWRSVTTSFGDPYGHQRGGVELTLVGPDDALVRVDTAAGTIVARLATIRNHGVVDGIVRGEGTLRIQPGVGGLTSLGERTADITHTDRSGEPGWYVARVILIDGEMAWSSPIWVDR